MESRYIGNQAKSEKEMNKVYLCHLRDVGYCVDGTRLFFIKHGLDWRDFKRNGIEPEKLIATNDIMAIKLAEAAQKNGR